MKKYFSRGMIAILIATFVSCSDSPESEPVTPPEPEPVRPEVIEYKEVSMPMLLEAQNNFALHFFNAMADNNDTENLCVSPLSASYALAMVANGAEGETLREIMTAMGFEPDYYSLDDLNNLCAEMTGKLQCDDRLLSVRLANSIWLSNGVLMRPQFAATLQKYYDADARQFTKGSAEALAAINEWGSQKTNGLISKFLNQVPQDDVILLNTLYFEARFINPMSEKSKDIFYNGDGSTSMVDYLEVGGSDPTCYAEYDTYSCVSMPFIPVNGNACWLDVILPDKGVSLDQVLREFDVASYNPQPFRRPGYILVITLPKFKSFVESDMKEALKSMGMQQAFDMSSPGLTKMVENAPIYVQQAKQTLSFELNREGVKAAAESYFGGNCADSDGDVPEVKFINFTADRPFAYMVRSSQTGSILFIGIVKHL